MALQVQIACKLPNGYTIESGTPGEEGYEFYNIPGPVGKRVYGQADVPATVWRAWLKANAKLRHVVDKSIYQLK